MTGTNSAQNQNQRYQPRILRNLFLIDSDSDNADNVQTMQTDNKSNAHIIQNNHYAMCIKYKCKQHCTMCD